MRVVFIIMCLVVAAGVEVVGQVSISPGDSLPVLDPSQFENLRIVKEDGVYLEPFGNVKKTIARNGDMRYELVGDFVTPDKSIIEYAPMIVVSNMLLQNEMVVRVDYNAWHGDVIVACINDFAVLDDKILLLGRAQDRRIGVSLVYDMSTQRLTVCGVTSDWISFSPDKQWVIKGDPSYPKFREPIEKHFGLVVDY